jgi:hypothetical protein
VPCGGAADTYQTMEGLSLGASFTLELLSAIAGPD